MNKETEQALLNYLRTEPFYLTPAEAMNFIDDMVRRWNRDFSWYRRIIVDKQIELRKDGPHISIVSIPMNGEE